MTRTLRIGTRDSKLARWQAQLVAEELAGSGIDSQLVPVKSEGDLDLTTPLAEMGGKGVFTKALDEALLENRIDLAVHSYKDLPTQYPLPLHVAAVLEREDPRDALVAPGGIDFLEREGYEAVIATSSNRRRGQWLHRYPGHKITNIRGNVHTRLRKVGENGWDGAIFAAAGLKRVNLDNHISAYLEWMIPAPAQGAIAVVVREDDDGVETVVNRLNHEETVLCTSIERQLLSTMEAGCSAPLGAFAWISNQELHLKAVVLKLDGSLQYDVEMSRPLSRVENLGNEAARKLLAQGADQLVDELRGK